MKDILYSWYLKGRWQVIDNNGRPAEFSKKEDAEAFIKFVLKTKSARIIDLEEVKRGLEKDVYKGKCPECGGNLPK